MPTNSSSIEIRELIICKRYHFSASVDLMDYHLIDPPIHGDSISYVDHTLLMVASQNLDNSNPETNSMTSQDDDCLSCDRDLDPQWYLSRSIYPLSYSIPDELIVSGVPAKEHLWAEIIPGESLTYRFDHSQEEEYRAMYQSSMFGVTPWNSSAASQLRYVQYVEELLSHTRKHCSTSAAAQYFLSRVQSQGRMGSVSIRNILLLTGHSEVNYSRETLWIGLKRYISSIGRCADSL